jgi:hypothetical protein
VAGDRRLAEAGRKPDGTAEALAVAVGEVVAASAAAGVSAAAQASTTIPRSGRRQNGGTCMVSLVLRNS